MSQPGSISNAYPVEGLEALWAEIRRLNEQVAELRTARVGNRMVVDGAPGIIVSGGGGIEVQGGGDIRLAGGDLLVESGGSIEIQGGGNLELAGGDFTVTSGDVTLVGGDLILDGGDLIALAGLLRSGNFVHGSTGWRLQPGGNVEVNDITIRGGIIGNDALAEPVKPKTAHAQASNFSLSTTAVAKATATITVPSGFTQALVLATMSATAVNHAGVVDFFDGYADINAAGSPGGFDAACDGADGRAIGLAHTETAVLTGLGSSFTVRAMLRSGSNAWAADAFNTVNIDALVLFLR